MAVGKTDHIHFAEFDNSQMCYYDIYGIWQSRKQEWIRGLDHTVTYASAPEKAVAFETELLERGISPN